MASGDVVMTLLLTMAITSSVMSVGVDDVSRLVRRDDGDSDQVQLLRRTPGWGKRQGLHDSLLFEDKRRGWGKRDSSCAYWRSILLYVQVGVNDLKQSVLDLKPHRQHCRQC